MDHLPWYESSNIARVSVPFLCSNRSLCRKDEFFDFPQRQGWELNKSESLDQLAERAQAWLFFGLLALAGIDPDTCIDPECNDIGYIGGIRARAIITASFSDLLRFVVHEDPRLPQLIPAISHAESVMLGQIIPFIQEYEALESLHLWNSNPYTVLFSIDILLDTFKDSLRALDAIWYPIVSKRPHTSDEPGIQGEPRDPDPTAVTEQSSAGEDSSIPTNPGVQEQSGISEQLCPEASEEANVFNKSTFSAAVKTLRLGYSFFPKLTEGIPQSLFYAGRCRSLAHRLDLTSSKFYHLISLPNGLNNEDHSQCSKTSCNCFSVDQTTYRTRHTRDCVMCEDASVVESRLVGLIQNDEVPIIRSTMDRNGYVTIRIEKLTRSVDYTAISHVWAGGLGNFNANQLPQCQLQAIHRDVCQTITKAFNEMLNYNVFEFYGWSYPSFLKPREPGGKGILSLWSASTTCYYWMDTLCIPNNYPDERKRAINSMGRIYAGASAVLILDPALSSISYDALFGPVELKKERMNLLVRASPWMARSWPLQEAALALELYVKFADGSIHYEQEHLGISATLESIPNQDLDGPQLRWTTFEALTTIWFGGEAKFLTGDASPYTSDNDFVKVWNLLIKRTTSYQEDIPAIFATLLYKSASELLFIEPACRTRVLLGTMKSLPLDILCVEQEPQQQPGQWTPRLPGSSQPVSTLDTTCGLLQRVPGGFLLNLSETPTPVLICPDGLSISGGHFLLHDSDSQQYLVHIPASSDATSEDKHHHVEESHLILMLQKSLPGSSSTNYGVLCKINSQTEKTIRVQPIHNAITWRSVSGQEQLPAYDTRNVLFLDPYFSVYFEMDMGHGLDLRWSRFEAYPYRHLQAQVLEGLVIMHIVLAMLAVLGGPVFMFLLLIEASSMRDSRMLHFLIALAFLPVHAYFYALYFSSLRVVERRRARYIWCLSFWDVPKAPKTLSKMPFSIPLYFLIIDFAIIAVIFMAFRPALEKYRGKRGYMIALLAFVEVLYCCRAIGQAFLQIQWFVSTLEFRISRRSQRWYTWFAMSTLKFMSSSFQANWSRFLFICYVGLVAGPCDLFSVMMFRAFFDSWRNPLTWLMLPPSMIFVVPGLIASGIMIWLFFVILRDLVQRVMWTYSGQGRIRVEDYID